VIKTAADGSSPSAAPDFLKESGFRDGSPVTSWMRNPPSGRYPGGGDFPKPIEKTSPDMSTQTKSVRDFASDEATGGGDCCMMPAIRADHLI